MYRGVFMKKNEKKKHKKIIDLRRFFENEAAPSYENNMHTGMPSEYYYDDVISDSTDETNEL